MPNLIVGLELAVIACAANAATYNCGYNCDSYTDNDYVYFENDTTAYNCGGYANSGATDEIYVSHGETLEAAAGTGVYYCCDDGLDSDGYWIQFFSESSITNTEGLCSSYTEWVSLGANKYCQATKTGTWEWCKWGEAGGSSGIISFAAAGACVYNGSCSTFTHCGKGYYKNGSVCTACPNGGTTSGYTSTGISACYLPTGTSMSDTAGTYTCSTNAYYAN